MTMLKRLFATLVLVSGSMFGAMPALGTPITLGGAWTVLDEVMPVGGFFHAPDTTTTWTLDCPALACKFIITDLFVVTDQFEIYDGGLLIATTPAMPDWFGIGATGPKVSPPYTDDPDVAFASGNFSSLVITLATGSHSLEIRDIHIPPTAVGGPPFPDGTVAFRAVIPEPATLALLGVALVGLGFVRRKTS